MRAFFLVVALLALGNEVSAQVVDCVVIGEARQRCTVNMDPPSPPAPARDRYKQWPVPAKPEPTIYTYDLNTQIFYSRNSSNPDPTGTCRYTGPDALPTNPYPVRNAGQVTDQNGNTTNYGTKDARFWRGRVVGDISLVGDGKEMTEDGYCNAAGIVSTSNVSRRQKVVATRIDRVWDGIRFNAEPCYSAVGPGAEKCYQTVERVWVSNARDDAVECDFFGCQLIRDSLFDNVFSFLSINPTGGSYDYAHTSDVVSIENSLVRLTGFPYDTPDSWGGGLQNYHIGFLKMAPQKAPVIQVRDTVIAAEYYNPAATAQQWANTWASIEECSNNYFLWLPMTDMPPEMLPPPESPAADCFTFLTGASARDFWTQKRAAWIASHGDVIKLPGDLDPPTFR